MHQFIYPFNYSSNHLLATLIYLDSELLLTIQYPFKTPNTYTRMHTHTQFGPIYQNKSSYLDLCHLFSTTSFYAKWLEAPGS